MFDFRSFGFFESLYARNKITVQDLLWRKKLKWNDSLPSDLQKKGKYTQENFNYIYKIEVRRFYGFNSLNRVIHVFSDSSSHAFGCAVYFRNVTDESLVNVSFVIGKCRLVPLNEKTLSVLKLELQAAVTVVRIKSKLIENAKLNVNRILLWSDCKTF